MSIGKHSYVAGFQIGEDPGLPCEIGDYTGIGKNLYVHGADNWESVFNRKLVSNFPFGHGLPIVSATGGTKGTVTIGNDVWMGEDVKILNGVHVGNGAIVGAHSVVTKDVPNYAMVAGNPARIKYFRFGVQTIDKLLEISWWRWSEQEITERSEDFKNIDNFVKKYSP